MHATSLTAIIDANTDCKSVVNSAQTVTLSVESDASSNITISNQDPVVSQTVSGAGISGEIGPGSRGSTNYIKTFSLGTVTSQQTITITPVPINYTDPVFVNDCPIGSTPVASKIIINPIVKSTTSSPSSNSSSTAKKATTTTPTANTPSTSTSSDTSTTTSNTTTTADTAQPAKIEETSKEEDSLPLVLIVVLAALAIAGTAFLFRSKLRKLLPTKRRKNRQ